MDEYYSLIQKLPPPFCTELAGLNPQIAPHVQELRLRADQPALFTVKGRLTPCIKYLPRASHCQRLTRQAVQDCFLSLCRHSAYAYEDELRQGYFTIPGGSRVGVAGGARPGRFCLRHLAQPAGGALDHLRAACAGGAGPGGSVRRHPGGRRARQRQNDFSAQHDPLPGAGRPCVLRGGRAGRAALGAAAPGCPGSMPPPCDVYTQHPKAEAICMALRCMNPPGHRLRRAGHRGRCCGAGSRVGFRRGVPGVGPLRQH